MNFFRCNSSIIFYIGFLLIILSCCKEEPPKEAPTIQTLEIKDITSNSATCVGVIISDGGSSITEYGVCWSTNSNPTIADNKTKGNSGTGTFTSSITGMSPGKAYYVRTYAINSIGISYGNQLTLNSVSVLSIVTTNEISSYTATSIICGGNISNDGGSPITNRGVCWSTKENPSISDNKTNDGIGIGSFTSTITELTPGSTYYIRAFSTNSIGTSYGNQLSIILPKVKNYLQPSYILRKSELWLDYYSIPKSNGLNLNFTYAYDCANAIADFNGDGFDDILMSPSPWALEYKRFPVELYLNDKSNNKFTLDRTMISNNIGTSGAANAVIGDFNGDRKPDVFFPDGAGDIGDNLGGSYCSILLSSQDKYEFSILYNLPKRRYKTATSGDFDNDGDLDIFLLTGDIDTGEFLINDGKGNFVVDKTIFQYQSLGAYTCEMVDVNKDGYLDLLIGGHAITSYDMKCYKILWGNGKSFSESTSSDLPNVQGWGVSHDFAVEDIDGDGENEIIINRTGGSLAPEKDEIDNTTFYIGYRLQVLKSYGTNIYQDITDKVMKNYSDTSVQWIVWLRVEDIDKNGKLDIFDSDKGHYNTGKSIRWEQDVDGIFKRKY